MQEPVLPGCFLRAKAIGLMPMIDQVHIPSWKKSMVFFLFSGQKAFYLVIFVDIDKLRVRKMTRSLRFVLMILNTATTMISRNYRHIVYLRSVASLKTVSFQLFLYSLQVHRKDQTLASGTMCCISRSIALILIMK